MAVIIHISRNVLLFLFCSWNLPSARLKIYKQSQFQNIFINGRFFSLPAVSAWSHATFIFPLKQSLDHEGAVCLRQESNLASGKHCGGLLLKLFLARRNFNSIKTEWKLSRLL